MVHVDDPKMNLKTAALPVRAGKTIRERPKVNRG